MAKIESLLSNLSVELERHQTEISSILSVISDQTRQIGDVSKQISQVAEIAPIKFNVNDIQTKQNAHIKEQTAINEAYRNELVIIKQSINQRQAEIKALNGVHESLLSAQLDQSTQLAKQNASLSESQQAKIASLRSELLGNIEQLKKDLVVSPKDILDQNAAVMKKLEIAQTDGANALLKASNVDMALKILEKKLETLSLQMKKLDLTNQ
jgi:hypothetical protein